MPSPAVRRVAVASLPLAAAAALIAGCGSDSAAAGGGSADRPVVAATAPQIDLLLSELAGPGVRVEAVVSPTADVHEIELRPSQARALRDADLILRPGRENDTWASEALDQVDGKQVDVSAGLGGNQRHWWMDPSMAEQAAVTVSKALDELDPDGAAQRAKDLAAVTGKLSTVDAETKRCLATVPAADRLIVTDHDAAGAYAERYGLTVAGTISPGAEPEAAPSAQRIVQLETMMRTRHVKALFPIAPHGSALSPTIASRGDATLGSALWADALPTVADAKAGGVTIAGSAPDLADAATLNARSVAKALGAKASACSALT